MALAKKRFQEHVFIFPVGGPPMLARRWGRIINLAAMAAKIAFPNEATYCSGKSAVVGLTRALAGSWGHRGAPSTPFAPVQLKPTC